ncbi:MULTISPECIES: DoxX family protein [unclassified Mesorhizobium]|uniref:DoxX family protein n=1 Tax=unclassified Mesorhizobium TaxID=325217 RepID=UPI000FD8829C|nr:MULTISPECIES: DoxX family protein [unclassified Mesorhizobium]TGQ41325.1 DoxX family protein [Mesorhizobium sp. M00.F.Ca.ET.216.01.1.1]TIS59254.1 MAG: DoxX family membrane protein [Mesorhizobium sp.]TIS86353.1 MAG: DoxX family membrane protein [Mesorhizobium sp.]TJW17447.1 MAG: DoxX family membrane protein [Mesorhizobium sp.]TJW41538.1 MAG: DoxX family membrane protein [Mesorhizobium sp.]
MPRNALLLLSRLLLAALFVPSGFHALADIAGTSGYFAGLGLPLPTLAAWATGLFELIAGLLILVGLRTPIAALLLAAFCIAAGFIGHYGQGGDDPTLTLLHSQMLMKDIAISGGFLALAMAGAGAYSIDGWALGIGPETT